MRGKTVLVLAVVVAFVVGTMVGTAEDVFAKEKLTKLQKECKKEPKKENKIKPHCELLNILEELDLMGGIGPEGPQGEQGIQGDSGDDGAKGDQGEPGTAGGFSSTYQVTGNGGLVPVGGSLDVVAICEPGDIALSGGYTATFSVIPNPDVSVLVSYATPFKSDNPTGWVVIIANHNDPDYGFSTIVLCLDKTP